MVITHVNIYRIRHALKLAYSSFRRYKIKFITLTFLGFISGLFGSIGIGAIIPLFSFATDQDTLGLDFISQLLQKVFSILHLPYNLSFLLLFMVILFIGKAIVTFMANYMNSKIVAEYEKDMRGKIFGDAMKSSWPYLLEQKSGYLERVIMDDIYNSANILNYLSGLILIGTSLATYAVVALNISAPITITTLSVGGVIFLFLKPLFYKSRKLNEKLAEEGKATSHLVHESMSGAKIVKTTSTEEQISRIGKNYFSNLEGARVRLSFYQHYVGSLLEPIGFAYIAILFLYSYKLPSFNIAAFAAIIYLVQKMFSFIQSMQGKLNSLNSAIPYLKIVIDYEEAILKNKEKNSGNDPFEFKELINLKDVGFKYGENAFSVSNINFEIKKGEMVGIIGPSGSGKTTIADILLRLFRPTSGTILIDGVNVEKIDMESWRNNVGYVSQDIFLLNDTIKNNIKFYGPNVTEEDIINAAKMANIKDFIGSLPDKWDTVVGERGVKLSGGQRQRISLARALARSPQILILDEATSALDNESEAEIQKAIFSIKGTITIVSIAHRLSTIIKSDKLVIMSDGAVVEVGPPERLIENQDSYLKRILDVKK